MARITIEGQTVTVDDAFLQLPRAEQEKVVRGIAAQMNDGPNVAGGLARTFVGQGLAAGFGDEIEAFARSRFNGTDYDTELENVRNEIAEFRDEHPILATASELGGAVAGGFLVPGSTAARGASMVTRAARGAAAGAGYGAVYGAGTAEGGVADRGIGALQGAGLGAAGGAAAVPITAGAGYAVNRGGRALDEALGVVRRPREAAGKRVAEAIQADRDLAARTGVPSGLEDALAVGPKRSGTLQGAQARGQPATVLDLGGETVRAEARRAANYSPEARAILNQTIEGRYRGQADRITSFMGGIVDDVNLTAKREVLEESARAANAPAYQRAYDAGDKAIWSDELERLSASPTMQDVMGGAVRVWQDRAIADGFGAMNPGALVDRGGQLSFLRGKVPVFPNLQFWDYTKRILDDRIGTAVRAGEKQKAATLTRLKNKLVDELDGTVPEFRAARVGAAQFFGAEDALEAGVNFANKSNIPLSESQAAIAKMSPAEKELFEQGFVSTMIDKVNRAGDSRNAINILAGSPQARQKLNMALTGDKARRLTEFLDAEGIMDAARPALGNSTTARQLIESGVVGSGLYGATTGDFSPQGLALGALTGAGARYGARAVGQSVNARLANEVGLLLASPNPAEVQAAANVVANNPLLRQFFVGAEAPIGFAGGQIGVNLGQSLLGAGQ